MAVTTSLKLPEALKKRVASLAKSHDKTQHAFMVEAIQNQVIQSEQRLAFINEALKARRDVQTTGLVYRMADVHAEIRAIATGRKLPRVKPVKWRA